MKFIAFNLFVLGIVQFSNGLNCYDCETYDFEGESSRTDYCYAPNATHLPKPCTADTGTIKSYCRTQFNINDGVVTYVKRDCAYSTSDEDTNSNAIPTNDKCRTNYYYSDNTATTTCYIHCSGEKCNSITTSTTVYVPRKCVQCNNETSPGCAVLTSAVNCPSTERYCSTTQSVVYDKAGNILHTIVTKGCTNNFEAVDQCRFTRIFRDNDDTLRNAGYKEFTCLSTCDTDGCNTKLPDGIRDNEEKPMLRCHQCSSDSSDCSGISRCPSGSTHCKSTVIYMISERTDLSYTDDPDYALVSVVRECANEAVGASCTETQMSGLGVRRVVCQETCTEDRCNSGWPARPKCLQCDSQNSDSYDACIQNPDPAEDCDYPYQKFCGISDYGIEKDLRVSVKGYPREFHRYCSHYDVGTGCVSETLRGTSVQRCNRTCSTDGCNVGGGGSMPLQTFIALTLPMLFGWLTQLYF
uniref:uncharacterized protein LOC120330428 n=1 Tax=Styela clava TaxID=7725 RepID=UPI0019392759|nr:uncharacterized protein LOC120330428 [Styela clava]